MSIANGPSVAPVEPVYTYSASQGYLSSSQDQPTPEFQQLDGPVEFDGDDDGSDYEDLFADDDEIAPIGGGGDLTKRYNRHRETAAGLANKGVNASTQKKQRIDSRVAALAQYAGKITLDDYHGGGGGGGGGGKDKSDRATSEQVLDPRTRMILLQLINRGYISTINGVISTGKEANVYHALQELDDGGTKHLAIKVYKTAILVFKDRDRYVAGEHRFRHGYSKSNHRAMVKLWAEKELRNLKRLHAAGIQCPSPQQLRLHVLVMDFLGDKKGWPAPRLRDAPINGEDAWERCYIEMLSIMWRMYQLCKLVHADLSEYNVLYHQNKLWVIDVSQSVELDHPRTWEFLRMDIKNVTDFFRRNGVETVGMRKLFEFITETQIADGTREGEILKTLEGLPKGGETEVEEDVFRQTYLPRTLEEVYDYERDAEIVGRGKGAELVYKELLAPPTNTSSNLPATSDGSEEEVVEFSDDNESEGNDENDESRFGKGTPRGKKHEDKELKKEHKKKVKEEKREQRKTKMPKHVKKRLVATKKSK